MLKLLLDTSTKYGATVLQGFRLAALVKQPPDVSQQATNRQLKQIYQLVAPTASTDSTPTDCVSFTTKVFTSNIANANQGVYLKVNTQHKA